MKKLQKLSLKQMENEMPLLSENLQEKLHGGYYGDCFWQCLQYCMTGVDDDVLANILAEDYLIGEKGMSRADIHKYGVGISYTANEHLSIMTWLGSRYESNSANNGPYISMYMDGSNNAHAIVITGINASGDGGATYYDPQNNCYGTFNSEETEDLTYLLY